MCGTKNIPVEQYIITISHLNINGDFRFYRFEPSNSLVRAYIIIQQTPLGFLYAPLIKLIVYLLGYLTEKKRSHSIMPV